VCVCNFIFLRSRNFIL